MGKSTLSAALAIQAARTGRKVILCESDIKTETYRRIHEVFRAPPLGYEEREIYPGVWACNIDPMSSMEEYIVSKLKVHFIFDAVFKRDFTQAAVSAAPGAKELIVTLKLWMLEKEKHRGKHKWDLIVFDAPATGHNLFYLRMPRTLVDILKVGPLVKEAKKVDKLFSDPRRTAINLVTLPQEMAVAETGEFVGEIRKNYDIHLGGVFANMIHRSFLDDRGRRRFDEIEGDGACLKGLSGAFGGCDISGPLVECTRTALLREDLDAHYLEKLAGLDCARVDIPYIYTQEFDKTTIMSIVKALEGQVS